MTPSWSTFAAAEADRVARSLAPLIDRRCVETNVQRWIGDLHGRSAKAAGVVDVLDITAAGRAVVELLDRRDGRTESWVRVHAIDFAIDGPESVDALAGSIRRAFPDASLVGFAYYEPGLAKDLATTVADATAYRRYFVGRLATIRDHASDPRVRCTVATSLDFFEEYAAQYRAFHDESPELRDRVRVEPIKAMEMYLRDGRIGLLEIDGEFGGVISAVPACELGLCGWCLHERVIFKQYRGKGLGAAVIVPFVKSLPDEDDSLLWGHIAPQNIASARSAMEVGRQDVGGLFWVDL